MRIDGVAMDVVRGGNGTGGVARSMAARGVEGWGTGRGIHK